MKKVSGFLKRSIIFENPALVLLLGLCPLLATSASLTSGLCMGIIALVVLVLTGVTVSLLGRFIPESIKAVAYMVIVAFFISVAELLMAAFLPQLAERIGIYLPILAVSGLIFARAELSDKEKVGTAAYEGLAMGLGYLAVSLVLSFVRELFGCGTLFGFRIFPEEYGALVIASPPGALIIFGFLLAAVRAISVRMTKKEDKAKATETDEIQEGEI